MSALAHIFLRVDAAKQVSWCLRTTHADLASVLDDTAIELERAADTCVWQRGVLADPTTTAANRLACEEYLDQAECNMAEALDTLDALDAAIADAVEDVRAHQRAEACEAAVEFPPH